ncbi:MAG TPA: hypothetical protein VFP84_02660 [Kofleriaceae bacterium]|nr:hypothetical protein [Kofleriaceae bacterium]
MSAFEGSARTASSRSSWRTWSTRPARTVAGDALPYLGLASVEVVGQGGELAHVVVATAARPRSGPAWA